MTPGNRCCIIGCKEASHNPDGSKKNKLRFFQIPKAKYHLGDQTIDITTKRRLSWISAIGRPEITIERFAPGQRVCSKHFHKGYPAYEMLINDPDWIPTLCLGHEETKPINYAAGHETSQRRRSACSSHVDDVQSKVLKREVKQDQIESETETCQQREADNDIDLGKDMRAELQDEKVEKQEDYHSNLQKMIKTELKDDNDEPSCSSQGAEFEVTPDVDIKEEMDDVDIKEEIDMDGLKDEKEGTDNNIGEEEEEEETYTCLWCPYVNFVLQDRILHMKTKHEEQFYALLGEIHSKWKSGSHLSTAQKLLYLNSNVFYSTKSTVGEDGSCSFVVKGIARTESCRGNNIFQLKSVDSESDNVVPTDVAGKSGTLCDICGEAFKTSGDCETHKIIHHYERLCLCAFCGKWFKTSDERDSHRLLVHSGEKPYKCDVCGKGFKTKGEVKQHSVIHSNEKPYKCDICGKAFKLSYVCKNHRLIHKGERPHKCDICGKGFSQKGHIKRHKKTMHNL